MMAVLPLFTPAANASAPIELESRLVELYQRHADAVVRVKVALVEEQEGEDPQISLLVFSGFFISREGLVLTNSIPTDQLVGRIFIEKNGIQYLAEAIGSDPATNVALL
ncbi:MAG: serine protease, partial [Puniceicoccaceae bacterium]